MNSQLPQPEWSLTASVPAGVLVLLSLLAIGGWLVLHIFFAPRKRWQVVPVLLAGATLGSVAIWFALSVLKKFDSVIALEGPWGPLTTGVIAAVLVELIIVFYRFERRALSPWASRLILATRLAFIALLLFVLAEPTRIWQEKEPDERFVAVLVDESTSMDQRDPQMTSVEKLDLADLLLPGKIPPRLRPVQVADALRDAGRQIAAQSSWLRSLTQTDSAQPSPEKFAERREQAIANLQAAAAALEKQEQALTQAASEAVAQPATKQSLTTAATALTSQCIKRSAEVQSQIAGADLDRLRGNGPALATKLDDATSALSEVTSQVGLLDAAVADAVYQRLGPEARTAVDAAANDTRSHVARAVLAQRPDKKPAVVQQLAGRYTVKLYRFANAPVETTVAEVVRLQTESLKNGSPTTSATDKSFSRDRTDLAAALEKVQTDIPRNLSGIVIVSDGRHNAKTLLEPAAHALALKNVPVAGVVVGSTAPVADAAVTGTSAPRSIQLSDRVTVRAELKLVGLSGQTAEVTLQNAGQTIETKKIQIPNNDFRTQVELADTPKKTGLASYTVQIAPLAAERSKDNNSQSAYVYVTDDPIRMLLIEGHPRWEYRYLRNLFADRDKSVRLQAVLLHPDRIEGVPAPAPVRASATRGLGESEATALPEKADDWFLFDVIVLGDVTPQELGPEAVDILKRFVGERGGRLIVIAGQNNMPHAFTSTKLAEMLPITVTPSTTPVAPPAEAGYYVRLTPEGEKHTIAQLDNSAEDNRALWESMPEQHVRYAIKEAKPGASVLAFAMPLDVPELFRRSAASPDEAEQLAQKRAEFISRNAVLATQAYGSGQVLFFGFDGSWRLRYRTGDTHHHRFWGQVMRWATTEKLPAGNELARFGTDRPVYEAGESVVARARLRDKNHAPVATQGATVVVHEGDREVLKKRLEPKAASPGMYETDLGPLPPGKEYRVALSIDDAAKPELAAAAKQATMQIVVTQPPSLEAADLSADRAALDMLARRTHGRVASPGECDQVVAVMGAASQEIVHQHRRPLWHSGLVLASLLGLVATEWIVRKRGGLT